MSGLKIPLLSSGHVYNHVIEVKWMFYQSREQEDEGSGKGTDTLSNGLRRWLPIKSSLTDCVCLFSHQGMKCFFSSFEFWLAF